LQAGKADKYDRAAAGQNELQIFDFRLKIAKAAAHSEIETLSFEIRRRTPSL
jgi:hypothetical protein